MIGYFGKWYFGLVWKGNFVLFGMSGFDIWFLVFNFFENNLILSCEGVVMKIEGESLCVVVDVVFEFI